MVLNPKDGYTSKDYDTRSIEMQEKKEKYAGVLTSTLASVKFVKFEKSVEISLHLL